MFITQTCANKATTTTVNCTMSADINEMKTPAATRSAALMRSGTDKLHKKVHFQMLLEMSETEMCNLLQTIKGHTRFTEVRGQ